jgi:DNA-binding NtrC family response regulator
MPLQRYLILSIIVLILAFSSFQLYFIEQVKNQVNNEVANKSRALSQVALSALTQHKTYAVAANRLKTNATLKAMLDYHWPGNVRELSNKIERLALLNEEDDLLQDLLKSPPSNKQASGAYDFIIPEEGIDWDEFEKSCLQQALNRCDNNRTQAAKFLGLSYKTFVYRINKFALE